MTKDDILKAIAHLKATKPPNWKRDARKLLRELAYEDDPFAEHVNRGNENTGRKIHHPPSHYCPTHDNLGENSFP